MTDATGTLPRMLSPASRRLAVYSAASLLGLLLAGCSHHHSYPVASAPPPPPIESRPQPQPQIPSRPPSSTKPLPSPPPPSTVSSEDDDFIAAHRPIYSEEGVASWYGPPYHNRRGANGEIFDQNALTAAHRTLPMGSLIVVTNEKTGQSATMRVTDRGPFSPGRILDLSMASAKATGIYRAGLATVRIDVYQTPKPMESGGRWCVQIGAFEHEHKAEKLRDELERKFENAKVIDFEGPTGFWVRIRPEGDNREQAESIARRLRPEEGDAYLVRLD